MSWPALRARCYEQCLWTDNAGPTVGSYRRLGVWSSVTGTAGINQEEVGADGAGNPIWGTFQPPNAPGNFPDADPNYSNLPWYLSEPSEDPPAVFASADPSAVTMVDKYGGNFEYEKNVYEIYLTLPPGCVSNKSQVRFVCERIVGRGYAALYIAQSHDPADAVFTWAYNRSNGAFNYYAPVSAPYFPLHATLPNRFYLRVYAVDGSEPSATNDHFNAAAFNPRLIYQYDSDAFFNVPNSMYAADAADADGSVQSVIWALKDGEACSSDGQALQQADFETITGIVALDCDKAAVKSAAGARTAPAAITLTRAQVDAPFASGVVISGEDLLGTQVATPVLKGATVTPVGGGAGSTGNDTRLYQIRYTAPHPDGADHVPKVHGVSNEPNGDEAIVSIIEGSINANGFDVITTVDDNGAVEDPQVFLNFTFEVDRTIAVISQITSPAGTVSIN